MLAVPLCCASEKALLEKALLAFTPDVKRWRCTINPTVTVQRAPGWPVKSARPVTIYLEGSLLTGKPFVRTFFIGYYDNLGDGADVCVKFNKMVKKRDKERKRRKK